MIKNYILTFKEFLNENFLFRQNLWFYPDGTSISFSGNQSHQQFFIFKILDTIKNKKIYKELEEAYKFDKKMIHIYYYFM